MTRLRRAAAPLALFLANAFITFRLFHTEYVDQMGSIEAVYHGLARYILAHFPDLRWFPLWYGGIPYPDTYPPLLHFMVAATAAILHLSPGLAYHAVTALLFALMPVALYWTATRLGASRLAAFAAALLYSVEAPSMWLVPAIRHDSGGWFGPHRLIVLVRWGEGPHFASILFLILAIGLIHAALERRTPLLYFAAALACAATVLSNWIGAFALVLALAAYLLAGFADQWLPQWLRAAAIGAWAYAIAMPWATPGIIATIRANAPLVGGRFEPGMAHHITAAVLVAAMLLLAWILKRYRVAPAIRFGILFVYNAAVIVLAMTVFQLRLLPQPERYHMEMDVAIWLAAALAAAPLASLIRGSQRRMLAAAAVALLCLPIIVHQRRIARDMETPFDVRPTAEYRISSWLGEHRPGTRVFAPGTIAFWMNAFSDTPLLNGGFDNGIRNTFLQDVNFQILFGDQQWIALAWLQAFGCQEMVGGDHASTEIYHPINHPEKFQGLPELWREGPEVIYDMPWHRRSLAHAVRASDLPPIQPLAYDPVALKPYLAALEDPALPDADFQWHGTDAATITGNLRPEHLLSVQVTWDKGWNARVDGQPRRVWGDKLGQMVVEPQCSGPCTVELFFDGGTELKAARVIHGAALAGGLLWILVAQLLWRKRSASPTTN